MFSLNLLFRKDVLRILVIISIILCMVLYQKTQTEGASKLGSEVVQNNKSIVILLWTATTTKPTSSQSGGLKSVTEIMNGKKGRQNCEARCEFSLDKKYLNESDAIVYFLFTYGLTLSDLPTERTENQLWVMLALEPPPFLFWKDPLKNQFNLTMTYRFDSDIWTPYGKLVPRAVIQDNITFGNKSLEQWINQKTKLATAVISRCETQSKREILIESMNKSMEIDVFGKCGKMPSCGTIRSKTCDSFWTELSTEYKFYLAFENSVCKDYITEKFWRSLELGIVPVVYGGGNYLREAPPGSFVDVQDFKSADQLAQFLKGVGNDEKEYGKYFEWQKQYRILSKGESSIQDWCSLCKAVKSHVYSFEGYRKSYNDSKLWWESSPGDNSGKTACLEGYSFLNENTNTA